MTDEVVHAEIADGVRTITLDSPHNRNALSRALTTQLLTRLDEAGEDDQTHVVVLAAEGKAFCAGADLKEASGADSDAQAEASRAMLGILRRLATLPQPVVARVHAPVRAGGIGVLGACDIVVAAQDAATFALTEVRIGLAPAIISLTVQSRMSERDASATFLTGSSFDGRRAAELGLVTRAVPDDELDAAVAEVVGELKTAPRQGLAATKELLNRELVARIDRDGQAMTELSARLFQSEVAQEIMQAFLSR